MWCDVLFFLNLFLKLKIKSVIFIFLLCLVLKRIWFLVGKVLWGKGDFDMELVVDDFVLIFMMVMIFIMLMMIFFDIKEVKLDMFIIIL